MSHEDNGNYAAKHPPSAKADERIVREFEAMAEGVKLSCPAAEEIATRLGVDMGAVGMAADLGELKISACQLGLFGHGKGKGDHGKDLEASEPVEKGLEGALLGVAKDGRISCVEIWKMASDLEIPRRKVSQACETLGLKIKPCQLGAF